MRRCGACNRGAVTAVTGFQGLRLGPRSAPGVRPRKAAAGWLRARTGPGSGTGRHRLTGCGLGVAAQPVALAPRSAGGLSTVSSFQSVGRNRTCDKSLSGSLYQTELPVVACRESNQALPFGAVSTTGPLPDVRAVRHTGHQRNPTGPGLAEPAGRTLVPTLACERSTLASGALSIARCVPAHGLTVGWPFHR